MSASTRTSASEYGDRFAGGPPPSPKPGLVEVEVDAEIVVYDPQTDLLHHLDRTASVVWSLLDGELTLPALAELLAAGDPVAETTLRRDVLDLAGVLWDRGLLRGSGANVPTERRPVGRGFVSGPLSVPLSELGLGRRPLPAASHRTRRHRALEHEFEVASNDAAVRDYLDDILIDLDPSVVGEPDRYELLCLPAGAERSALPGAAQP